MLNSTQLLLFPETGTTDQSVAAVDSSAVCDYSGALHDAADTAWRNLVAAPADGETQAAYDMPLGSTSDPTYNSSGGYWSTTDINDYFALSSNTTFIEDMGLAGSGQDWTMGFFFRTTNAASGALYYFSTDAISGDGLFMYTSNLVPIARQRNTGGTPTTSFSPNTLATATDVFMFWSYDDSANEVTLYATGISATTKSWTFATGTDPAATAARIFWSIEDAGFRAYSACLFNTALSTATIDSVVAHVETREGIDVTP